MKKAKIEKKLAKALFNDKERAVIMNSLYYSVHKYKQHGDTDNAVFVQAVANRVAEVFDIQNQKYTKAEVDAIVENALKEAKERFVKILDNESYSQFKRGYQKAMEQFNNGVCVAVLHHHDEEAKDDGEQKPDAPSNDEKPEGGENKDNTEHTEGK
jgi:hypothetical protein